MNSSMMVNAVATRPVTSSRTQGDNDARCFFLERENAYLTQNNAKLRLQMKDLEAASLSWIRLYEAALERANTATAECARLRGAAASAR
jgi:cell division protein FtsB